MGLSIVAVVLALIVGATGSPTVIPTPDSDSVDVLAHPNSVPETEDDTDFFVFGQHKVPLEDAFEGDVMATGELNPNHYPAQRAAKVVQHYLNTRYGSPFNVFMLDKVHSGNAEDVAGSGIKYQLNISVQDFTSKVTANCSAEVLFPTGGGSPQVQASSEELEKINTKAEEDAFYQKYKNQRLQAEHLPDSHGRIEPEMEPLWHLGAVASSFIMLNQSTEDNMYNMAQVANVTQLETENNQLKFDYHILLHEIPSQNIIHWKMLFSWTPSEGVKALRMEKLPHRHCRGEHC